MNFEVPQYVDLEDKLAFRLTLKQLGWFALGGFILFILWTVFEKWVFWTMFPVVVAVSSAFAFYRPAGLSLITFLIDGFKHLVRPKKLTWTKGVENITLEDKYGQRDIDTSEEELERTRKRKEKEIREIGSLAKILDEKSDL